MLVTTQKSQIKTHIFDMNKTVDISLYTSQIGL